MEHGTHDEGEEEVDIRDLLTTTEDQESNPNYIEAKKTVHRLVGEMLSIKKASKENIAEWQRIIAERAPKEMYDQALSAFERRVNDDVFIREISPYLKAIVTTVQQEREKPALHTPAKKTKAS